MRLPLIVLTAALVLLAIRWLGTDGRAVVRSAPGPTEQALDREDAVALVPGDDLEGLESPTSGRQPVANKDSVPADLALEFERRHRSHGPAEMFADLSGLRSDLSVGVHEVGVRLFRAGRGVLHRGKETKPNEELATYWMDDEKRLVRVEIPEAGNHKLYQLHREARWLESQLDSFRWDAAEMQKLSKTVFGPSGAGADVRREFLNALRAPKVEDPEIVAGPFGTEVQPPKTNLEREDRLIAGRNAYMAARATALAAGNSGSGD